MGREDYLIEAASDGSDFIEPRLISRRLQVGQQPQVGKQSYLYYQSAIGCNRRQ